MKEAINSIVNLLTYMALGAMLLIFGISMYHMASPYEMLIFFGLFLGMLLFAVVIGYTGNRAFPNFEIERYRVFFFFVETIGILLIASVGIALRLEAIEKTGIVLDNWGIYETASIMNSVDSAFLPDIVKITFIERPALFFYSIVSALSLNVYNSASDSVLYIQLVLNVLFAIFSYRVARKVSGRLSGLITFAIMMCMPSLVASVGFVDENIPGLVLVLLQIWIFYSLQKRKNSDLKAILKVIFYSLDGLLMALAIFAMPENAIIFVGELIYILILNIHAKKHIISSISLFLSTAAGVVGLVYAKSVYLVAPVDLIIDGYINYFKNGGTLGVTGDLRFMLDNLTDAFALDNYADKYLLHNLPMENEMIYGNLLLMSVCCLIFLWSQGEKVYFVLNLFFLLIFGYGAVFNHANIYHLNIMPYLAILTGVLFEKIYVSFKVEPKRISKMVKKLSEISLGGVTDLEVIDLNKEDIPDKDVSIKEIKDTDKDIINKENKDTDKDTNEASLINTSDFSDDEVPTVEKLLGVKSKNVVVDDIEAPLDNPLPGPKKNERKELDYDIEVDDNDDFDV